MIIKGRQYLEEDLGGGTVRLRMKDGGYHVDVDRRRLESWIDGNRSIQDALPELNSDQREFLISGLDPADFEELFGKEEP